MTLFNRHFYSPFSNEWMAAKNVHTPSSHKLNYIFSTKLDSVMTGTQEEHGGSGKGPALLYFACVLLCKCTAAAAATTALPLYDVSDSCFAAVRVCVFCATGSST